MRCTRVCRNDAYDFLIIFVLGKKQYINQEKNTNYILRVRCIIIKKYSENIILYTL